MPNSLLLWLDGYMLRGFFGDEATDRRLHACMSHQSMPLPIHALIIFLERSIQCTRILVRLIIKNPITKSMSKEAALDTNIIYKTKVKTDNFVNAILIQCLSWWASHHTVPKTIPFGF